MEAHRNFFKGIGGVPHTMVYDNMRVAVVFDEKSKKPTVDTEARLVTWWWKNTELEPSVGWSWTLQSGKGLLLGLSYPFYVTSKPNTTVSIYGMPKISFGIEF